MGGEITEDNTPAEGVVSEGGESEGGVTIRERGESFNTWVPKNIEGSSPRTKTSYGAAATKVDEGAGFIPGKEQLTANLPTKNTREAKSTNPSPKPDVMFFDLEPPSHQVRVDFPSPPENTNDGDPKSNTHYKAGNSTIGL